MLSKFEAWIRSLDCVDVDHGGSNKVGVEGRCSRYLKLGFFEGGCYNACVEVVLGTGCWPPVTVWRCSDVQL